MRWRTAERRHERHREAFCGLLANSDHNQRLSFTTQEDGRHAELYKVEASFADGVGQDHMAEMEPEDGSWKGTVRSNELISNIDAHFHIYTCAS